MTEFMDALRKYKEAHYGEQPKSAWLPFDLYSKIIKEAYLTSECVKDRGFTKICGITIFRDNLDSIVFGE
jgi:hypothetical protein